MEPSLVKQLADLAMETGLSVEVDWNAFSVSKQEAFESMAEKVYEQLDSLPEEQRAIVAMATVTRLLVENYVLKAHIKDIE